MRTAAWTDSVSVLDRVTAVFDAFGEDDEGLGISELARRAHLPKSTVSRIAADLVAQRFLDRDGDRLYLGVRLFELAETVQLPRRLRHVALPVMNELRDVTRHSVRLAVLQGSDVLFIAIIRGEATAAPTARVGGRLPAHATALGKALLAYSPRGVVEQLVRSGLPSRTPATICDPAGLARELADVRRLGVAADNEECHAGRACVASPVLGPRGEPVAAISVAGAASEIVATRLGPAVRAAALTLSRRMDPGPHD
ncbi:IclR family transcriptional regulator [Microbacterium cremeum]|uniref:IclR family transcriptional regulator n=1 Tax=Microbacterium cremeum TaxID=2782169 RepID=UPI001887C739|nr:IclR family transcriptional regulator [Microbacterium cremeum]